MKTKCHSHPHRKAVACGRASHKGYCRECWPANAKDPVRSAYLPPFDATIWLAALVALALALVGGVGCGGERFSSAAGTRPTEDAGAEGSLGGSSEAGGSATGGDGSPMGLGGRGGGSVSSKGGAGGSGGSGGAVAPPDDAASTREPGDAGGGGEAGSAGSAGSAGCRGCGRRGRGRGCDRSGRRRGGGHRS